MTLDRFDAALVIRNGWEQTLARPWPRIVPHVEARGLFVEHLWDLVLQNAVLLARTFVWPGRRRPGSSRGRRSP